MNNAEIKAKWAKDQKRQFCKQSCSKIDQGLGKFDLRSGERAIWELFQNARDLAKLNQDGNKEAHISIELTPDYFIFKHQGLPFTHDSLNSLVMQVSSRSKEDEDTVGQYGTGFLTTHVFGRRLYIDSSLDLEECDQGKYVNINHFAIDRTYQNITDLVDKVTEQLINVENLADAEKTHECRTWTSLSYDLASADNAFEKACEAIKKSLKVLPYVLTVNEPIKDVEISFETDKPYHYRFTKEVLPEEDGLKVMAIQIDENGVTTTKKIYYLQSEDGQDIVIMPLKSSTEGESLDGIAKLFVYFPLLGTEEFGMDFVFHSKRFYPVEERNNIYLPVENANVKSKYEANVEVLNSMTDMVKDYLVHRTQSITNWVSITKLCFDCMRNKEEKTNHFFSSFKKKWSDFYMSLPIITVGEEKRSVNSGGVYVYSQEIVAALEGEQASYFDCVYDACSAFPLPSKETIVMWSNVINSWVDSNQQCFLSLRSVASAISKKCHLNINALHSFDLFIKETGNASLFNDYALIFNRGNCLNKRSVLQNAKDIPNWLYELSKDIIPSIAASLVHMDFNDIEELPIFSRKDLKDAINNELINRRRDYLDRRPPVMYNDDFLKKLAKISVIFKSEETKNIRRTTLPVVFNHLGLSLEEHILKPISDDEPNISYLPFKHVVENLLLEISQMTPTQMEEQVEFMLDFHSAICGWNEYFDKDRKEGYVAKYAIFPNQVYEPCLYSDLRAGKELPEDLIKLYKSVFGKDLRKELVDDRFVSFVPFETLDAKMLAKRIEDELADKKFESDDVLDIINRLEEEEWQEWFPRINEKKADLFMKAVKPECKDGVFKLMKIDDPNMLEQLAKLAEDPNLDEILRKGREVMIAEHNKQADFAFKKDLGQYVEDFIRKELSKAFNNNPNCINVKISDIQHGQDFIIFQDENPLYYLEVKSRWGADQSVMMSPLQMQQSVKHASAYSLCCVDMTGLYENVERHEYPPIEEVIPRIHCMTNIGMLNEPLISSVKEEQNQETVHIGGDYKCIVPQSVIKSSSVPFDGMLQAIIRKIKEN